MSSTQACVQKTGVRWDFSLEEEKREKSRRRERE
jgi:hypothetical protein